MSGRWSSAAQGALSGGTAGSAFGPWGAVIGAITGGGLGYAGGGKGKKGFFSGNEDEHGRVNVQTQGQEQGLNDILSQLRGQGGQNYGLSQDYLSRILSGDQAAYDQFAAPYLQNFHEQIIPRLAEQFGALGGGLGGGVAGSSGFGQAIGGAGAGLQAQLASLYANMQQNAAGQAMGNYQNLGQLGLGTRAFEPYYQPGNIGFLGQLGGNFAQGFGQNFGQNLGNKFQSWMGSSGSERATGTDVNPNIGFANR